MSTNQNVGRPTFASFISTSSSESRLSSRSWICSSLAGPVVKSAVQALSSSGSSPGRDPRSAFWNCSRISSTKGGGFSYESTTPRSESRDQRLPGPSQSPRPIQSFEREVGRLKSESGVRRDHPDIRRQPACRRTSRRRGVVTSMLVESVLQPEVRVPDRPRLERAGTPDRRSPRPCCDRSRWSTRRVTAVGLGRDR